ncbi:efflux RND transporter periplasmic adaptor subunit [Frateuria aurantia]
MKQIVHQHLVLSLLLVLAAGPLSEVACAAGSAETPSTTVPADPLRLTPAEIKAAGIVVSVAAPRIVTDRLQAPGEVKVDAYSTTLISPRVASQVIARKAKLGDVVAVGQPLVVLSSIEVAAAQGRLIIASLDWSRVAALGAQAVSARRYNEALVQRDQAMAELRAYGMSDGQIGRLLRQGSAAADGRFELLAPSAGRVTSDDFMVGERIEPGRALFTIVAEDTVWVEARLAPGDAERVKTGAAASVLAHGTELAGTVVQRSHQTDATTRTASLRIRVPNRQDLLHAGELVEARVAVASQTRQLAVPSASIVLIDNQATVFIRPRPGGTFEPVSVEVGESRDGWTEVKQGLQSGTAYVSQGAFVLKARILRSRLGEE